MEHEGHFGRSVCTQVSGDKNVLLFLRQGEHLSHGKFYDLLFGRKREVRELFLYLLFLKHLQLKIINMLKPHILG